VVKWDAHQASLIRVHFHLEAVKRSYRRSVEIAKISKKSEEQIIIPAFILCDLCGREKKSKVRAPEG